MNYTGTNNTFIGSIAGQTSTTTYLTRTGNQNTYLGYLTSANSSAYSNSTAVGYGAQITASNQVVLGTSNETVVIPGPLNLNSQTFTYIPWTSIYTNYGSGLNLNSVISAVTTNPTPANNANTGIQYIYSVVGKCLYIKYLYIATVAGTAGSGVYRYLLPAPYNTTGLSSQLFILSNNNHFGQSTRLGTIFLHQSGNSQNHGSVYIAYTGTFYYMYLQIEQPPTGVWVTHSSTSGYSYNFNGTSTYHFDAIIPLG